MTRTTIWNMTSGTTAFRMEEWFIPMDHVIECVTRMALVFANDGRETVVLLSPTYATTVAYLLTQFAAKHS